MTRLLLFFVFLFGITLCNAQPETRNVKTRKGLTDAELQATKTLYAKMMESETAKLRDEAIKKQVRMSNGVMMPPLRELKKDNQKGEDLFKEENMRKLYTEYWTINISRTKFLTVDEAVDAHMEPFKLQLQMRKENPELYKYMDDATIVQLREIKQIEIDASRKKIYERLEERQRRPE